ncbi:unnamed protein product [Danaus chrysippus]|uniref:(African queen) hypothetical protein n=1 Tax=Danaus chrysippus TaxID=151541 RepID=A0A8J2WBD2_9NEOP|nr:unnamed protein product [Danaus chrysippus]
MDLSLCQGRDDEATTITSTDLRGPRRKTAQYYRDYRARKRAEMEKELLYRISDPSTNDNSFRRTRKTNAEYQREYRARLKAKRNKMLNDSLAVRPATSTGGFTTTHQSTVVDQLTSTGLGNVCLYKDGQSFRKEYQSGKRISWRCVKRGCPLFFRSEKGTTRLIFEGIRFSKNYQNGSKISWRCNKAGCIARVNTIDGDAVVFTLSRFGKPQLRYGQYRFSERRKAGPKTNWQLGRPGAIKFETTKFGNPTITWGNYRFTKKLTRHLKTCGVLTKFLISEPKFGLSQRGNLVVQIGEWRFNKHASWGSKVRWTCIKKKSGYLTPVFAQSQRGNPVIMIGQYRFNRVNKYGSRTRWVCVKAKAGCRASLHTMENAIVRVWGFHDPMAHTIPVFGKTRAGNPVIMVGTYRFNKVNRSKGPKIRWTCVKTPFGCRAAIYTIDDVIIKTINDHNH